MAHTTPPRLKVAELVRLQEGGEIHTVVRVTPAAAYLAPGDWRDERGQVLAREWPTLFAVSPFAFVDRVGDPGVLVPTS